MGNRTREFISTVSLEVSLALSSKKTALVAGKATAANAEPVTVAPVAATSRSPEASITGRIPISVSRRPEALPSQMSAAATSAFPVT